MTAAAAGPAEEGEPGNPFPGPGDVTVAVELQPDDLVSALQRDARAGLTTMPKSMPPVWFYDRRGSDLYEQITRLPEYYPFRVERDLLHASADDIAALAEAATLVELGSGTSEKTGILLDAMRRSRAGLGGYVAFDVSEAHLREAGDKVARDRGIGVYAIVGDFHAHLPSLPAADQPRLVAFLGSTIGNLLPDERHRFLAEVVGMLGPRDHFLLATDLVKPVDRLLAAYDDAAGVTAEFNRNLLHVLNRELGADFEPDAFAHVARWDPVGRWIEMRLRSTAAVEVTLPALDLTVAFAAGEEMRTEISAKFTPRQVEEELAGVGLAVAGAWSDPAEDYLLTLARPDSRG